MKEDKEKTLLFEDGIRKIDYILTYTIADKEHDKSHDDNDCDNRTMRRNFFLDNFEEHGLEYEIQDCSVGRYLYLVCMQCNNESLSL